jgi:hypothetical protein
MNNGHTIKKIDLRASEEKLPGTESGCLKLVFFYHSLISYYTFYRETRPQASITVLSYTLSFNPVSHTESFFLRDSATRFFASGFYHESSSPCRPLIMPIAPFQNLLKNSRRNIFLHTGKMCRKMRSPHGYRIISYLKNWPMLAKLLYTFVNKNKLKDCPLTNAQIGMQQKKRDGSL